MKKVLLVEDEELLTNLLQIKLTKEGYEFFSAKNGEEGLRAIRQIKPDLILLDIVMPKMGGFEVMERMKDDPEIEVIPVVIISNSGHPVELERAKELGAKDWLIKTDFDPQEVIDKVAKQIGR